ncbi:ankyrin repeat domain-containing protein [Tepidibacter mesophilus]|uniref:ankyrin repeat domain-containing protein n=1 Tax=Tepidibacter mesophilus TaxID=655607 RepID=UPI000C068FD1|nr:ankyrin repeat domain-containing protein [Tepidibacter mesophilus]
MKITNAFDAVRDGTYEEFIKFYTGNINAVSDSLGLNLLSLAIANDKNPNEKIKIIKFLIPEGIDINFTDKKDKRNALHIFYFNVLRPSSEYMLEVTNLLVENGIDVNRADKYNAIPLKYAIIITKLATQDIKSIYQYLLEQGSDYNHKDIFEKSCVDYANEYSWRNDVMRIIKEFENGNK